MVWWHVGVNNYGYGILLLGEVQVQSFACPIAIALFILGLKKTLLHVFLFFLFLYPLSMSINGLWWLLNTCVHILNLVFETLFPLILENSLKFELPHFKGTTVYNWGNREWEVVNMPTKIISVIGKSCWALAFLFKNSLIFHELNNLSHPLKSVMCSCFKLRWNTVKLISLSSSLVFFI